MCNCGRSGPRARRTSTRHVPEPGSCSIGPCSLLWPTGRSLLCPSCRQPSSAATHVSNGMSTMRRNDSQPGAEPVPIAALRLSPRLDIGSMSTATCRILTFMSPRLSGDRAGSAKCGRRTRIDPSDSRPARRMPARSRDPQETGEHDGKRHRQEPSHLAPFSRDRDTLVGIPLEECTGSRAHKMRDLCSPCGESASTGAGDLVLDPFVGGGP